MRMKEIIAFVMRRYNIKQQEFLGCETANKEIQIFTTKGTIVFQDIDKNYFLEPDCNRTVGKNRSGHLLPPAE